VVTDDGKRIADLRGKLFKRSLRVGAASSPRCHEVFGQDHPLNGLCGSGHNRNARGDAKQNCILESRHYSSFDRV
jgi:hypothetical protein